MPQSPPQTYATHRRYDPLWHFVGMPIISVAPIFAAVQAWRLGSPHAWGMAAYYLAVAVVFARAREQTKIVQDRVIRLEMRQRLRDLLPPTLAARIGELTPKQLVGLRFAGDGELPGLVERCLSGELTTDGAIKREIRDWQADWLRA